MDLPRRTFSGTLAALLEPFALGQNVELCTPGPRRAAEESLGVLIGPCQ